MAFNQMIDQMPLCCRLVLYAVGLVLVAVFAEVGARVLDRLWLRLKEHAR